MICPETKQECGIESCCHFGCYHESAPQKPTLAEIERLVDAYGVAGGGAENKAALMAAIEKYGAQNGKT